MFTTHPHATHPPGLESEAASERGNSWDHVADEPEADEATVALQ